MLCADAMVGAAKPILQVAEDKVDDRRELFGHLGGAASGDGVVIEAARPQAAIGAPIVGDDPRPRHDGAFDETTQRIAAAIVGNGQPHAPGAAAILPLAPRGAGLPLADFDGSGHWRIVMNAAALTAGPASDMGFVDFDIFTVSGTDPIPVGPHHASAELVKDAEGGPVSAQSELPLKPHRGHALGLTGDQIGGPEPCAQGRAAALHDRADRQSCLAGAGTTGQHARARSDAVRFAHDAAARAGEPVAPTGPFQVGGAGRVIGEEPLKLGKGPRKLQVGAVENVHSLRLSMPLTHSISCRCM